MNVIMIGFFFRTRHILFRIYHIYTLKNEYNDKYSAIFQPFVNFGVSSIYFIEKKNMEKGFKDSAFRLNDFVKNCDQWTETEMIQRQQDLLLVIKKLWPMPTSNFHVTKQEAETASLDDEDFEFAGKKLQAYTFLE